MSKNTRRYFEELDQQTKGRAPGSPEFEALVRSKIGGQFERHVSPQTIQASSLIGPADYNFPTSRIAGVNFLEEKTPKERQQYLSRRIGVSPAELSSIPEGKRIFGVGRYAGPDMWAHEYRHESVSNERANRLFDVVYGSTSLPAYKTNIEGVYQYLLQTSDDYRRLPEEDKYALRNLSLPDKEDFVLDKIRKSYIVHDAQQREDIPFSASLLSTLKDVFTEGDMFDRSKRLNKEVQRTEDLPYDIIQMRAKLPFLNFVGRLAEPVKKAKGDSIAKSHGDFIAKKMGKKRR